jgi:glycosyltransferase involved in cell wall biosynthesis
MSAGTPRPRVMLLIRNMEFGGAQVIVNHLLDRLNPDKYALELGILMNEDFSLLAPAYRSAPTIHRIDKRPGFDPAGLLRLWRLLVARRIDIVYTHGGAGDLWGRIAGLLARVPILIRHSHINQLPASRIHRVLHLWLAGRTNHVIAIGEGNRTALMRDEAVPPDRITVVTNTVDVARFQAAQETQQLRTELGLGADARIVTIIGRLTDQKGHRFFLETARLVHADDPAARFLIVGTGPLAGELRHQAAALGLGDIVHFLGARRDIPEILASTDVFVISSLFEGLPLVLLEAMAAGKAIVTTDIDGCRELIEDGVRGLRTPPRAPREQAAAIRRLLRDPALRNELGRSARDYVLAHCSVDAMVRDVERVLDRFSAELTGRRR